MNIAPKRLKKLRLSKNLTQKKLAKLISISPSLYSSWERGENKPSLENIEKIASQLGCNPSELIISDEKNAIVDIFRGENSSYSYFIRATKKDDIAPREQKMLKVKLFNHPLIFQLSNDSEESLIQLITNDELNFIWIETYDDKVLYVNKDSIEWLIFHNDDADEYPDICNGEFYKTPLLNVDVTKKNILYMMARNGNYETNEDFNPDLCIDFEWLIKNDPNLISETENSIAFLKSYYRENYNNFLNDTKVTEYEKDFLNSWGIRIFLKTGKEIFLPGMFPDGKSYNKAQMDIESINYHFNNMMDFLGNENHYIVPIKEISLIEYPLVFNAIADYDEFKKTVTMNNQEVNLKIRKLFELVWNLN